MIGTFRKFLAAMRRQILIVLSIATYDNDRRSTESPIGSWESIISPLQIMFFFIAIRVGFSFLRGSTKYSGGGSTDMYFNIVIFIISGFTLAFLFRQIAINALSGLKLRAPLYYQRVRPIDILLALSLNDIRAMATISFSLLGLIWALTWSFQLDSPGLALCVYFLTIFMAIGFGICLVFLEKLNKWIKKIIRRILQRLIFFTSGIFFATFELPAVVRPLVAWNPLLHAVELFRYALNNNYPIPGISLAYLTWCSLTLLGFSLILYRANESLLLKSSDN